MPCCSILSGSVPDDTFDGLTVRQGITFINGHMETAAAGEANVTYVSCNEGFMANGQIDEALMPDALHPSAAGELANLHSPLFIDSTFASP